MAVMVAQQKDGRNRPRFRMAAGLFGLAALAVVGSACSGGGDEAVVDGLSASGEVATDAASSGDLQAGDQFPTDDSTDSIPLADPSGDATSPQSVLVVLGDSAGADIQIDDSTDAAGTGDTEGATGGDSDSTDAETATSSSTTTTTASGTGSEETTPTTKAPTIQQTSTTAQPTTTAEATTTMAPTTAAPTTTTTQPTTTTTQAPSGNSNFPNDGVVMVSSGSETTFSSQVAGSTPVVIWYWLPG